MLGSLMLKAPSPHATLRQSGFWEVSNPYRHTARDLVTDVRRARQEASALLSEQGYGFLLVHEGKSVKRFPIRRDPFAPIAPPTGKQVAAQAGEHTLLQADHDRADKKQGTDVYSSVLDTPYEVVILETVVPAQAPAGDDPLAVSMDADPRVKESI